MDGVSQPAAWPPPLKGGPLQWCAPPLCLRINVQDSLLILPDQHMEVAFPFCSRSRHVQAGHAKHLSAPVFRTAARCYGSLQGHLEGIHPQRRVDIEEDCHQCGEEQLHAHNGQDLLHKGSADRPLAEQPGNFRCCSSCLFINACGAKKTERAFSNISRLDVCALPDSAGLPMPAMDCGLSALTLHCNSISMLWHLAESAYRQAQAAADRSPCWSPDKALARGNPAYTRGSFNALSDYRSMQTQSGVPQ